ncbi:MAG: bifunctional transaldolase/phosoglucose isomerase [Gemmatimonadetes bacterium]|nr:bifunctional transaldolase/phosoglucose isomerase [Gemmatimonadota bacterium]
MNPLLQLIEHGQSYWMDDLTRGMIRRGELERRVSAEGLRGITSNPKIFGDAISKGDDYDEQIRRLVEEGRSVHEIYEALVVTDVRDACDILRPVYDESRGVDGFVSLEVSPYLAHDTQGSMEEARRLFRAVDRPNVFIKIPGTPAGVPAVEDLLFEGISINITLLFSIESYEAVARTYIRALERRAAAGKSLRDVASVASFFLSRIDVLVDRLLAHRIRPGARPDAGPRPQDLLGKVAVANAKMAYQKFQQIFDGEGWRALEARGARVQRVLWASTGTKDPLYSDVWYVEPLIGPYTVNTMPTKTIAAVADHGAVAQTVEEGVDEARRILEDLGKVGIDLERVTEELLDEGIQKFVEPYDALLGVLAEKRRRFLGRQAVRESFALGAAASSIRSALESLDARQFARRLFTRDPYLWKSEPGHVGLIRNRLGWLEGVEAFRERTAEIRRFAEEVRRGGARHVVLLGMGGSSLCAEVAGAVFGSGERGERGERWPKLLMLDDTDPEAVHDVESGIDPERTVFIVASKSGTTTETLSFYRYFYERLKEAIGDAADRFIAITDPGTPLAEEAREKRFRACFENPADIGGRYSALSYFGLVPMALVGIDIDALLACAHQMRWSCGPMIPAAKSPGLHLGAALGMQARAGRDKVTFAFSESIAPFGAWLEQLLAESTGKEGRGLIPVDGEPLGEPGVYGNDRVFVSLTVDGDRGVERERRLEALEAAGHPVLRIGLADRIGLGAEFFRWELATATAGAVLGVNPFDEPNVAESKRNTEELLAEWERTGAFARAEAAAAEDGIAVYAEGTAGLGRASSWRSVADLLRAFLDQVRSGDYVAVLPYFRRTPERDHALRSFRVSLRDRLKVATALGYGPRYLHSTGQLHKGGPGSGVFLLITGDTGPDVRIPGRKYGFATLHRAQALGDFRSLVSKKRRVVRVHLTDGVEEGLRRLAEGSLE